MRGKVNILLVDDKPEKLLALEAVLEDLGQNIVRAYSGREALRAILQQDFAVILLDVNMPDMDGFETAALIRQRKNSEHIPIIFITAFTDEMHVARGYSLGAVDYMQAPIVPEVLRTKVAVFVDLYVKTDQVRRQADALRRRANQLQRLAAASVAIHRAPSLERMLQTVTETARELIGAHQAITLYVHDGAATPGQKPHKSLSFTSFSDRYATWRTRRIQLDQIATTIVATGRTAARLTEAELRDHPDWEAVRNADIPPIHGGMLAAPLLRREGGANLGVIYLADRYEGDFTHDDEAIAVQLAQMASTAAENITYAEERETNRVKDEFLATLSHELRTPLNAILGWTQLLRLETLNNEATHGVDVIERNAKAQTKLIEDLLDVSRITTGKLRLNVKPTPLTGVVQSALDVVRPAAEAKQITLACEIAPGATEGADVIHGDPDRLQQVVWNLLANAVKFTPNGGRVRAILRVVGEAVGQQRQAEIAVEDNGPGIASEFLPYVFDRFRQADASSTRSHGGLGIGLTIVRHIVELHGGEVRAESAGEGRGATFVVRLPLDASAVKPAAQPAHDPDPAEPSSKSEAIAAPVAHPPAVAKPARPPGLNNGRHDLHGLQILVIDDEPDAREMVGRILTRAGAQVQLAGGVREALERFGRSRPHVVFSDIAMPEHDGFDLIRRLRELPPEAGGSVPAVALTAYAREEDRVRTLSAGFDMHLAKPVEPDDLISAASHLCAAELAKSNGAATPQGVAV